MANVTEEEVATATTIKFNEQKKNYQRCQFLMPFDEPNSIAFICKIIIAKKVSTLKFYFMISFSIEKNILYSMTNDNIKVVILKHLHPHKVTHNISHINNILI